MYEMSGSPQAEVSMRGLGNYRTASNGASRPPRWRYQDTYTLQESITALSIGSRRTYDSTVLAIRRLGNEMSGQIRLLPGTVDDS